MPADTGQESARLWQHNPQTH